jgi:hypothetical protein
MYESFRVFSILRSRRGPFQKKTREPKKHTKSIFSPIQMCFQNFQSSKMGGVGSHHLEVKSGLNVRRAENVDHFETVLKSSMMDTEFTYVYLGIFGWFEDQESVRKFIEVINSQGDKLRIAGLTIVGANESKVNELLSDIEYFDQFWFRQIFPVLNVCKLMFLKKLAIWEYHIDERFAGIICSALQETERLKHLGISYVMNEKSQDMIFASLSCHTTLEKITVEQHRLSCGDDRLLIRMTNYLPILKDIKYSGHVNFERWAQFIQQKRYSGRLDLYTSQDSYSHGQLLRYQDQMLEFGCKLYVNHKDVATGKERVISFTGVTVRSLHDAASTKKFGDLKSLLKRKVKELPTEELQVQILIEECNQEELKEMHSALLEEKENIFSVRLIYHPRMHSKCFKDYDPVSIIQILEPTQDSLLNLQLYNFPLEKVSTYLCQMKWNCLQKLEIENISHENLEEFATSIFSNCPKLVDLRMPNKHHSLTEQESGFLREWVERSSFLSKLHFVSNAFYDQELMYWKELCSRLKRAFSLNIHTLDGSLTLSSQFVAQFCKDFEFSLEFGFLITLNQHRYYAAGKTNSGPVQLMWSGVDEIEDDQIILGKQVGSGTHSVVRGILRDREGKYQAEVAVKILDPMEHATYDGMTRRATEKRAIEHKVLAQLEHPNTVHYFGFTFNKQGCLCLITELLSGTLEHVIGLLDAGQKLSVLLDIAHGMDHLHRNVKVAHRDLKPPNIFVSYEKSEDGKYLDYVTAKVGDFGTCREFSEVDGNECEESYDLDVDSIGTPPYISPEFYDGIFVPASDVFSFGLIMMLILAETTSWQGLRKEGKSGEPFDHGEVPYISDEVKRNLTEQMGSEAVNSLLDLLFSCLAHFRERPNFSEISKRLDDIYSVRWNLWNGSE